jgi:hypothetical protein
MSGKAFIVIAGRGDVAARDFAARYADRGVRLMTPRDLSQSGWSYRVGDAAGSTVANGGRVLEARGIAAILTRLPYVSVDDLPHIAPVDRAYVAAEMTAFLLAWLAALECPRINRPTAQCLSGPAWSQETWVRTAARIGLPTEALRRHVRLSQEPGSNPSVDADGVAAHGASVTVVGRRCIGAVDRNLKRAARALADAAGTELLFVRFSGPDADARFLHAHHWANLDSRETDAAVWQCLNEAVR